MKLAVISDGGGNFRVHRADCQDVPRETKRWYLANGRPWTFEADNTHDVHTTTWGDVASDNFPEGSDEWHTECDVFGLACTRFLPCCGELTETYHHTDPRANLVPVTLNEQ